MRKLRTYGSVRVAGTIAGLIKRSERPVLLDWLRNLLFVLKHAAENRRVRRE